MCGRSILEVVVRRTDVWANSTAGKTYKFSQKHISNWMHPISFGCFPDGFYGCLRGNWGQPCEGTEVDSWVAPPSGGAAGCDKTKDCQHPLFYRGKSGDESLEVQDYEHQFEYPVEFWYKNGTPSSSPSPTQKRPKSFISATCTTTWAARSL